MPAKRILILNGHPAETSLSNMLADTYERAATEAGHEARTMHLHALTFDPDHGFAGYKEHKPLEADLVAFRDNLEWADHVVLTTPMWWGGLPAKLKGLLDRALLPGWAFDTRKLKFGGMPTPLLTGKTGRVFVTSDTPDVFFGLLYRKALLRQIKGQIFQFVGIKPTRITHFAPAGSAEPAKIHAWLELTKTLAVQGK
ncbi:flavodoxin family protein [Epibacterium sp. SM1969]|uniref:Flavodoxin family protein n=1 Tax=Tritonibacter aquimaris TaxID=2663379 RepID=A0A844AMD7_9RHOB|nr:NAD(P)H-dependent oxidoreductase [Tritonibacter aquimaris]MQY43365.1 flavodoxin family protein [Tritonibacter aquimaris]